MMKRLLSHSLAPPLIFSLLALAGCGTAPTTTLEQPAVRVRATQALPETRPIWQCVHQRLRRYVLDDRPDANPIIIEISPWLVLIARSELPSSLTPMAEVLLTEAGPKLKYVEGLRPQTLGEGIRFVSEAQTRQMPGLARAPALLRLNGSLQFGESAVETAMRGFNLGLFSTSRDGSGSISGQLTTASVTLSAAMVDPATRTGGYGSATSVKVNYLRTEGNDGSFAVSFNSTALGWNNVRRSASGPEPAVRMGMTVTMTQGLSHATRTPINECLASVAPTVSSVPLELVLEGFRMRRAKDEAGAARWLNYSRAYYGAIPSEPEALRNNASSRINGNTVTLAPAAVGITRTGLPAQLPIDEALAVLLARGAVRDTVELEFLSLYANLWRVPQATYDAGAAWVRAEQSRLQEAARIERERIKAGQDRVRAEQQRQERDKRDSASKAGEAQPLPALPQREGIPKHNKKTK